MQVFSYFTRYAVSPEPYLQTKFTFRTVILGTKKYKGEKRLMKILSMIVKDCLKTPKLGKMLFSYVSLSPERVKSGRHEKTS